MNPVLQIPNLGIEPVQDLGNNFGDLGRQNMLQMCRLGALRLNTSLNHSMFLTFAFGNSYHHILELVLGHTDFFYLCLFPKVLFAKVLGDLTINKFTALIGSHKVIGVISTKMFMPSSPLL